MSDKSEALKIKTISTYPHKWERGPNGRHGSTSCVFIPLRPNERIAQCACGRQSFSQSDLPFFKSQPTLHFDEYYCGCRGWG